IQLAGRLAGLDEHRLGICRRATSAPGEYAISDDGGQPPEFLSQLVPLAIVPDQRDRPNRPDAEGGQVVDDGPEGPRVRSHPNHLIRVQTRLDGWLGEGGVDVQVAVEKEVAEEADPPRRNGGQDFVY